MKDNCDSNRNNAKLPDGCEKSSIDPMVIIPLSRPVSVPDQFVSPVPLHTDSVPEKPMTAPSPNQNIPSPNPLSRHQTTLSPSPSTKPVPHRRNPSPIKSAPISSPNQSPILNRRNPSPCPFTKPVKGQSLHQTSPLFPTGAAPASSDQPQSLHQTSPLPHQFAPSRVPRPSPPLTQAPSQIPFANDAMAP
ncbi:putative uncharacterized protein DDB_G0290521 [Penaeus japonicus]|uniref:putative uncharacterized protein DDB_G0290521 n=1 Tax=Penaeus japonicus TaxID=27405 RepID=UPI001C717969|nr:putative uncharacterized protein DDB_G0290521 [Penaeus japonicus]